MPAPRWARLKVGDAPAEPAASDKVMLTKKARAVRKAVGCACCLCGVLIITLALFTPAKHVDGDSFTWLYVLQLKTDRSLTGPPPSASPLPPSRSCPPAAPAPSQPSPAPSQPSPVTQPLIPPGTPPTLPTPAAPPCALVFAHMANLGSEWCNERLERRISASACEAAYVMVKGLAHACVHSEAQETCLMSSKAHTCAEEMSNLDDGHCDETVAYAFLTRGSMPLWSVWEAYFAECPADSAVPIFHSQNASLSSRAALQRLAARYGGRILNPDETVYSSMRFSWGMIAAMLHLYRDAATLVARNGCPPRFVHLASERDVPVVPCSRVHAELASTPGVSRVQWVDARVTYTQENVPPAYRPIAETSQWMTLWMDHALTLANDEERMKAKWWPHWYTNGRRSGFSFDHAFFEGSAPDEIVLPSELIHRGLQVHTGGLTWVLWCGRCTHVDNNDGGSPAAFVTYDAALEACRAARAAGFFFARKFGDGSPSSSKDVSAALLSRDCLKEKVASPRRGMQLSVTH